jgi:hypothetical protein
MFLDTPPGQATAANGAVTLNDDAGLITTEALTTGVGLTYTLTIATSQATDLSIAFASLSNGSNSQGDPTISTVKAQFGKVTIVVTNRHATLALNGTLKIAFQIFS